MTAKGSGTVIPLIIGAAAAGLVGLALSGDDKKNSSTTTAEEIPSDKRNLLLTAPAEGQLVSLSEVGDKNFSSLGFRGAAVKDNRTGKIISPFNGRVLEIFDDGLYVESSDGVGLAIQFGQGKFFFFGEGDQIKNHDVLAEINLQVSSIVMFAVTNDKDFGDITFEANGQTLTLHATENFSTEDNDMEGRKFTILGETGSGKTCYLLGMYYEMSMSVAGYTVIATDPDADKNLTLR